MLLQLDPPIPVQTEKGPGKAVVLSDYGEIQEAVMMIILNSGPIVWLRTSACRRATDWTNGYDPEHRDSDRIDEVIAHPPVVKDPAKMNGHDDGNGSANGLKSRV